MYGVPVHVDFYFSYYFLMMEDAWVIDFCQAAGLPYDAPALAREGLPGGQRVHWT